MKKKKKKLYSLLDIYYAPKATDNMMWPFLFV